MNPDATRLRDAFDRLADEQPAADRRPSAAPPPALVRELRRRQRTPLRFPVLVPALAASLTAAALVVGLVLGLPTFLQPGGENAPIAMDVPSPQTLVGAIPDLVQEPGAWIPRDTTPGVAAVVLLVEHGDLPWGSTTDGAAVVSAETGAYTWLELPLGGTTEPAVALSPTGRYLAYWSGVPRDPDVGGPATRVTDFRVRDLVTGEESSFTPRGAPLGVAAIPEGLTWIGPDRVGVAYQRITDLGPGGFAATDRAPFVMDARDGSVTEVTDQPLRKALRGGTRFAGEAVTASFGFDGREVAVLSPSGDELARVAAPRPSGEIGTEGLSPDGSTFVQTRDHSQARPDYRTLFVTPAVESGALNAGTTRTREVPVSGADLLGVLGWVDDDHVVVSAYLDDPNPVEGFFGDALSVLSLDVGTGEWSVLTQGLVGDFADALWTRPTVSRSVDAAPTDPRLVAAGGLSGVVVVGGGAAWLARRRRWSA